MFIKPVCDLQANNQKISNRLGKIFNKYKDKGLLFLTEGVHTNGLEKFKDPKREGGEEKWAPNSCEYLGWCGWNYRRFLHFCNVQVITNCHNLVIIKANLLLSVYSQTLYSICINYISLARLSFEAQSIFSLCEKNEA